MKPHAHSPLPLRAATAGLIFALMSCSGPRNATSSSQNRHPYLSLHQAEVSRARLISDAELKGGKVARGRGEHLSIGKTCQAAMLTTAGIVLVSAAIYASVYGATFSELPWPSNIPDTHDNEAPTHRTLQQTKDAKISITGMEIRYVPSKHGRDIELARAAGQARVDVTDKYGSYYCRADEVHYRKSTNEIILHGRASVSAAYAPGIRDFGLARIDLARCVLEYSSKEEMQPTHSHPEAAEVADLGPAKVLP